MGLHWKHSDLDELCRTAGILKTLLEKLLPLLKSILGLMERLHMEDSPVYREYKEASSTLEQLQHTNEFMVSQAESCRQALEMSVQGQDRRSCIPAPEAEESPDADAREGGSADSQNTEVFDRAPAPEASQPSSRDVRILFSQSASMESGGEDTASFSLPSFRRISRLARKKPAFSRRVLRKADVTSYPEDSRRHLSFQRSSGQTEDFPPIDVSGRLAASRVPAPSSRPSAGTSSAPAPVPATVPPTAPPTAPPMNRVQFSAVVPRTLLRKEYSVLHLFMYEKEFHLAVEEVLQDNPGLLKEHRSGVLQVQQGASVRVELSTHNLKLTDNDQTQTWLGEYLRFDFPVYLPENFASRQIMFTARVYINDLIATRLYFVINCAAPSLQIVTPRRRDVLSAFMSYAREDRTRAAAILLGMQKARPDLNVFFDVESLRSGENWRETLPLEIARRDLFFLCWSHFAKDSVWVNREWNCALKVKGLACIEPIPLESPDSCPPPQELDGKQFNDRLLYLMHNPPSGA